MMKNLRWLVGSVSVVALVACGGGGTPSNAKAPTSAATGTGEQKVTPKKAEATPDPAADTAAKAHKVMKDHPDVVLHGDEIDVNSGLMVQFATGSDDISPDSYDLLSQIAEVLDENPDIHIRVEGNTDNTGSVDANYDLSARRADAVADFLVAWGISADRVDSIGCGPDNPVADNATDAGKTANRRVEFIIVKDTGNYCAPDPSP